MPRNKRMRIKVPVYDSEIDLIITNDISKTYRNLCKRVEWLKGQEDDDQGSAYFLYHDSDVGNYYMLLTPEVDIFLISHEVLHATFIILEHHDVKFDKDSHEAFTYLHGHLMEVVYNKIKVLK